MEIKLTNVDSNYGKRLLIIVMKTFFFLLCTTVFAFSSNKSFSQDKVNIDTDKLVSVDEVFTIIKAQTDYTFIYQKGIFKNLPKVQLKKGSIQIKKLLEQSLSSDKLSYEVTKENTIIIKENPLPNKPIRQLAIKGKVIDTSGEPLPNITVRIKETNKATATDFNGVYSIIASASDILVFTAIGFEKQEVIIDNQTTINITLKEAIGQLDEIVINAGYYKTSKKEATSSIAKINSKEIEEQPVTNPLATMQGRMPGVSISQTTGVPGGNFKIQIRGTNSIGAGNDPLYIIDGVPYSSSTLVNPSNSGRVFPTNISPLSAINSADIESIEVLKDADATAIYGSRGANGVVLISTKKGKKGNPSFSINTYTGIAEVANFTDLMSTEQYLEMRKEAYANDGITNYPAQAFDINGTWDQSRDTDWQKEFLGNTSYFQDLNIRFNGGNAQTNFLLGSGLRHQTTVFAGDSDYDKASVLLNVNHASIDKKFKADITVNYVLEENNLPVSDLTQTAATLAPNAPEIFNSDGSLNWAGNTWGNPYAPILYERYSAKTNNLLSNINLSFVVANNLTLKGSFGYNEVQVKDKRYFPSTRYNPAANRDSRNSAVYMSNGERKSWIVEPQINYENKWSKLSSNILIGGTFQQEKSTRLSYYGQGFPSNSQLDDISAASTFRITDNLFSNYRYQAIFGRLNLNWDSKYILNLTGRRDGSSRFGEDKRFANFGAIGLAWIFSKEDFFTKQSILSFGKLRGSFGITGNDQIGDYEYLDTYEPTGRDYNGLSGLAPTRLYNPIFGWETNRKIELGLELGFFEDRIFTSLSLYRNRSSNQLVGIPQPGTTGFTNLRANLNAVVENRGLEIDFKSINFKSKYFQWSSNFNISLSRNELRSFPGLENSTYANTLIIGESLNIVKLYNLEGVNTQTGIYEFTDFNGDGNINFSDDRQYIAEYDPRYFGGFGNEISYKNWNLNFLFQFVAQDKNSGLNRLPGVMTNQPAMIQDRWQNPGDNAKYQRYTSGANSAAVTAFSRFANSNGNFVDASYIRLKNIYLSYNLTTDLIKEMSAKIYFQGQNLFTITNFEGNDPEYSFSTNLAPLRQFSLGIQLNF